MGETKPMGERMAAVETWQTQHEILCASRFSEVKNILLWLIATIAAAAISLMGWMAVQLYTMEPLRMTVTQSAPPAAVSVARTP